MPAGTTIKVGDIVLARFGDARAYGLVRAVRLGRLVVERCDGRPCGPVAARDVASVYKPAGVPEARTPRSEPLRPTAQMRLDLGGS